MPMGVTTYPEYLRAAIAFYAADNVAAGRWPEGGASERSRSEFAELLPLGLHVFAFNKGAQALYRSLGFKVASLNLRKPLT